MLGLFPFPISSALLCFPPPAFLIPLVSLSSCTVSVFHRFFLFIPLYFSNSVSLSVPQPTSVSLYLSHLKEEYVYEKIKTRTGCLWVRFSAAQQPMESFQPARSSSINWLYACRFPDHSLLCHPSRWYKTLEAKDTQKNVTVPRANGLWNESAWPTCSSWPPHNGDPQLPPANPEGKQEETCPRSESTEKIRRVCWMQIAQAKIFPSPVLCNPPNVPTVWGSKDPKESEDLDLTHSFATNWLQPWVGHLSLLGHHVLIYKRRSTNAIN